MEAEKQEAIDAVEPLPLGWSYASFLELALQAFSCPSCHSSLGRAQRGSTSPASLLVATPIEWREKP